jgi:DNA-binding GntR family transcriptional regulator
MVQTRRPLADQTAVHDQVYEAIRQALITGRIAPGKGVSLRSLAGELGVSPMPVRDAVRRLVAERALAINPANKRLSVPSLTADRLEQLSLARLWVEPELAARAVTRAVSNADSTLIRQLQTIDADVDEALRLGDVDRYMSANHAFHFALYERAAPRCCCRWPAVCGCRSGRSCGWCSAGWGPTAWPPTATPRPSRR